MERRPEEGPELEEKRGFAEVCNCVCAEGWVKSAKTSVNKREVIANGACLASYIVPHNT